MASFMLIGGKLADIPGKRRTFIIGMVMTTGLRKRKLVET
jgi:MFS family permease